MSEISPYDYKVAFLDALFERLGDAKIEVLDLGSGTSQSFPEILRRYSNIHYTGVEFKEARLAEARRLLAGLPNVNLLSGFGEDLQAQFENRFDVTLSLSVLEHVKRLEAFLQTSVDVTKPGGLVVHRYDLGHSLYSRPRERLKVFLCNHVPAVMPARSFTCHPKRRRIEEILHAAGAEILDVSYSQLPGLKGMMKRIKWSDGAEARRIGAAIVEVDKRLAEHVTGTIGEEEMEYLFPTITIKSRKLRSG